MAKLLPNWSSTDASALLPFAHVRLVVADLDGTLLAGSMPRIYAKIEDLCRSLSHARYDVLTTIATGRTYAGARALIEGLALRATVPIILYNGSVVVYPRTGHAIVRREIRGESLTKIFAVCATADVSCLAYFFTPEALGDAREQVIGRAKIPPYGREFNGMAVMWNREPRVSHGPSAVLVDVNTQLDVSKLLARKLSEVDGVSVTSSGGRYIEVRPAGSDKATALRVVAESLAIKQDEILALGDNDNDAEMLSWVGIGVAVSSASTAALSAARFQCSHGVAQGAIELLRLIREAKRYYTRYQRGRRANGR